MKWQHLILGFVLLTDFSLRPVPVIMMASDEHPDVGHDQSVHPNMLLEANVDVSDVDTNGEDYPYIDKDNYEDADWHPPNSLLETHIDLTPDPLLSIHSKNTSTNDARNQESNQSSNSSSLQCGEYSSHLTDNGQCQLMATLPAVGVSQNRCPDMFRCTDDISHWLQENWNRKVQLKELWETMSELQKQLRNHRHGISALEMQGEERVSLNLTFDRQLHSLELRHTEADMLLHVHAALLHELQEQFHNLSAIVQERSFSTTCKMNVIRSTPPLSMYDKLPPDGQFLSLCPSDCASLYHNGVHRSGVYTVVLSPGAMLPVYCDMETDGGGWTVFQRRTDGSVTFNRGWSEYRDGFGEPAGEHWLGNQHLHLLSNQSHYSLRIHLQDWSHTHKHALYHTFRVEDEQNHYRLHVSGFSGTVEDSFGWYHHQHVFSTPDTGNICAEISHAGWWFHQCFYANLNGVYYQGGRYSLNSANLLGPDGIVWFSWTHSDFYSLKAVTMMIRPRDFRPHLSP